MNENEYNKIKDRVLQKIQSGEVSMRPRFHFMLQLVALVLVVFFILMTSSLLISYVIFSLVESGRLVLLGFGFRGILTFFTSLPWMLILIEIVLIVLLEYLLKQFKLGYRSSFSTLFLVILCMSVAISLIIDSTSLHHTLQGRAEKGGLPFVREYYRGIIRTLPNEEIFRGTAMVVGTSTFVLDSTTDGEKYLVALPPGLSLGLPEQGQMVFVAGILLPNNVVQAYGFQKLSPVRK
jgi:hypothetical protein